MKLLLFKQSAAVAASIGVGGFEIKLG